MCNNKGNILICGVTLQDAQDFLKYLEEQNLCSSEYQYITTCSEMRGCGMQVDKVYLQRETDNDLITALVPCTSFSPLHWCERFQFFYRENDSFVIFPKYVED